jgi:hypothetical protein
MKIFLCGHGGWNPGDGYTKVPKGSTITFYNQNAKLLKGGDDYKVIQGSFWGQADSVVREFHTCPNMRLYPDNPAVVAYSESIKQNGTRLLWSNAANGMLLSDIFAANAGNDFVWACCRHVKLREQGGEALGVNLVEERNKFTKYDYDAGQYITVMPRK